MQDYGRLTRTLLLAHHLGAMLRVVENEESITLHSIIGWTPASGYYQLYITRNAAQCYAGVWCNGIFYPASEHLLERWIRFDS